MCGIVGQFLFGSQGVVDPDSIMQMLAIQRYRGPDASGVYLDDYVGLGHNRLSIIDLHSGTQPIHNEDETLWIVFNGEVFNYPELRQGLLEVGHRFHTSTDTEVILHLYEDKGADCLHVLNGQFAFAIWDNKKKELFLARDRMGIRPLHYTIHKGLLLFGSEIKSIFAANGVRRAIDPVSLDQVFTFWTTLSGRTIFEDIHELPAGHCLVAGRRGVHIRKYWEPPFFAPDEQLDWPEETICEKLTELITDATRIRLRADVPVGCYISGGLDSSAVGALVRNNFNNRLRTFGVQFEEPTFDETEYQDHVVSFLDTEHTTIRATNHEIAEYFPDVLWHCETPILRTAPVPLFLLSRVVNANGFKVVLTGEGADELFGGYNIFREAKIRNFWAKQPESKLRPLLIGKLYPYIFKDKRFRHMLETFFATGLDRVDDPLYSHLIRWENTARTKRFFSQEIRDSAKNHCSYDEVVDNLPKAYSAWDIVTKAQYLETTIFLSNYLLSSQGDRVAMAHSLEIRLPFLDYRVVEFAGRIPSRLKINVLNEKYILKKAFEGILPPKTVQRTKHPFRAPIGRGLLDGAGQYAREMLSDLNLRQNGLFDTVKVKKLIEKVESVPHIGEVDGMALAGIVSSQIIQDRFVADFPVKVFEPVSPTLLIDRRSELRSACMPKAAAL